jgi:hypothetical protein
MKEVHYLLNLFISYTDTYEQSSIIREFVEEIESYSDIDQVILCEKIRNQDCFISKCLNFSICLIDVCIFFCSEEARNTVEMCEEVNIAFNSGLEIIPIYETGSDIFPLIRHKKGVKVVEHAFNPQDVAKDVINIIKVGKKGEISN